MESPKQMNAGPEQQRRQTQQGQSEDAPQRRKQNSQVAETTSEQMQATHFSDWASI